MPVFGLAVPIHLERFYHRRAAVGITRVSKTNLVTLAGHSGDVLVNRPDLLKDSIQVKGLTAFGGLPVWTYDLDRAALNGPTRRVVAIAEHLVGADAGRTFKASVVYQRVWRRQNGSRLDRHIIQQHIHSNSRR